MTNASLQQQIDAVKAILKHTPTATNAELMRLGEAKLNAQGLQLRGDGMSNSVFTQARTDLGIVPTRGRPKGSKNQKTLDLERKAKAEAAMKLAEEVTTRSLNAAPAGIPSRPSTGIFTGEERINVFHGPVAPTLTELLRPVAKLMRERGISRIELDEEGLRFERTVTESLVL